MRLNTLSQRKDRWTPLRWGHLCRRRRSQSVCRQDKPKQGRHEILGEEGAAIIEFAVGSSILFSLLFGIMMMSLAFFTYHFVADSAREATRWAMVRGSTSCTNTPGLTECNATAAQIQTYVSSLGYMNIPTSDTTVSWLTASATQPTTWTACAGTCNIPGNLVSVTVTYAFPLNIPFVSAQTLNITSTSQMVISQ